MHNQIKAIISKIIQASKKKKNTVQINQSGKVVDLTLKALWDQGYIYGYKKKNQTSLVYLKVPSTKRGLFGNIFFTNQIASKQTINNLVLLERNKVCFVWTTKGLVSASFCKSKGMGGSILVRF